MTDEIKLREMEWSEISNLRAKANIKAAEAQRAWKAALEINTLGKSEEESMAAHDKRISTLAEYRKCHSEALRISDIANSMYIDKAGSDVEFYRKYPFQSNNPVVN
jgi:hypothetical protein